MRRSAGLVVCLIICMGMMLSGTSASAQMAFTDVASVMGIDFQSEFGSIFPYDYDNDGDLDFVQTSRFYEADYMFRNDGDQFSMVSLGLSVDSDGWKSCPMDFDHDGDLDLYIDCYHNHSRLMVYENGMYYDRTSELGLPTITGERDFAWVDLDHDGWMDLLIGFVGEGWRLYRNVEGTFENITDQSQLPGLSSFHRFAMSDADLDGDFDLFMTETTGVDHFYENIGLGVFTDRTASSGLVNAEGPGGCAWADFNNDKYPDILTQADGHHTIWMNNGDLTFTEMTTHGMEVYTTYGWNPLYSIADFDLDGDLDIFSGNSTFGSSGLMNDQLFRMDSTNGLDIWFTDVAPALGLDNSERSNPAVFDYDQDGDLDLLVRYRNVPTALLRNDMLASANRLEVDVLGPNNERDCWHTRVEVYPHGSQEFLMSAETNYGGARRNGFRHFLSLNESASYDLRIYFANGDVMLPEDYPQLSNIVPMNVDHLITIHRGQVIEASEEPPALASEYALHQNYPNPFNPSTKITFDLAESGFVTLKVYNLLGQAVATVADGMMTAGFHTLEFNAGNLASGLYVYRIKANGFTTQRKMVLMK